MSLMLSFFARLMAAVIFTGVISPVAVSAHAATPAARYNVVDLNPGGQGMWPVALSNGGDVAGNLTSSHHIFLEHNGRILD